MGGGLFLISEVPPEHTSEGYSPPNGTGYRGTRSTNGLDFVKASSIHFAASKKALAASSSWCAPPTLEPA